MAASDPAQQMLPAKTHIQRQEDDPREEQGDASMWWENAYQESKEVAKLYEGVTRISLGATRRFGRQVCEIMRDSGLYDRHGMVLEPHPDAPETRVQLYRHDEATRWTARGSRAGAAVARRPYMLLLQRVRAMALRHPDSGMVLVYYAALRKIVRSWLKHAGLPEVPVRTVRQSKGDPAGTRNVERHLPGPHSLTKQEPKQKLSQAQKRMPAFSSSGVVTRGKTARQGRYETEGNLR